MCVCVKQKQAKHRALHWRGKSSQHDVNGRIAGYTSSETPKPRIAAIILFLNLLAALVSCSFCAMMQWHAAGVSVPPSKKRVDCSRWYPRSIVICFSLGLYNNVCPVMRILLCMEPSLETAANHTINITLCYNSNTTMILLSSVVRRDRENILFWQGRGGAWKDISWTLYDLSGGGRSQSGPHNRGTLFGRTWVV